MAAWSAGRSVRHCQCPFVRKRDGDGAEPENSPQRQPGARGENSQTAKLRWLRGRPDDLFVIVNVPLSARETVMALSLRTPHSDSRGPGAKIAKLLSCDGCVVGRTICSSLSMSLCPQERR